MNEKLNNQQFIDNDEKGVKMMDSMIDKKKDFMTTTQVVEFFDRVIGYQKILRMTRNGILPAVKIGKSYYYQRTQLQKWADTNFSKAACARIRVG